MSAEPLVGDEQVLITKQSIDDLADAIRTRNGVTDTFNIAEMPDAIAISKRDPIVNGTIASYYANSGRIGPNTFISIVNGKVTKATSTINGLTKTRCTTSSPGEVYILTVSS